MRRGRLDNTKGPMRRGLTTYLRLSLIRELEAGPGGGPASRCLEITPFRGRRARRNGRRSHLRALPAWAAETGRHAGVKDGLRAVLLLSGSHASAEQQGDCAPHEGREDREPGLEPVAGAHVQLQEAFNRRALR